MLLHEICEFMARKEPDAEALVHENGRRESWRALEAQAERIAAMLAERGIRKGDRVCFLGRNCLEVFHVLFACSKIGALYVPLNYRLALPEIVQVLEDCRPKAFLAHLEYADALASLKSGYGLEFVRLWLIAGAAAADERSLDAVLENLSPRRYFPVIQSDDPSWVCYTGGTTGRGKGVLLSHKNMVAGAFNFIVTCEIVSTDVYLVAGALFHIALAVPFAYWLAGGKVVLTNFQPDTALGLIAREDVTQMVCTGTIFKMLIEAMERAPVETRLRLMFCGGAPVSPEIVQRAGSAFRCRISQIYGQTECTLMATYLYPRDYAAAFAAADGTPEAKRLHSVGRAAPMCLIAILDDSLKELPAGHVGEIAVRGDAVMLGYANMPEQTADTLVEGWLRTGDLGYMDEDAYIYLVDRKKDMIITGGENVYSQEVELVLIAHSAVSEAVVLGIPDDHWGEQVIALVVPATGSNPDPEQLRAFCRERLAGYKVPKRIEFRDGFPRLPTGKIAKGDLRKQFWGEKPRQIHGI
jgi:long-chain acyl-CoA synthetase